jgi:WD40 repeat protein
MGNLVSIENLNDSHDQKLMRGHDMPVCALAVSPSGAYVASGQIGTKAFKGTAAPIFVWSTATGRRFRVLRGLSNLVSSLAFSTDERFICGCADDCLLYIWDLATAEVVYGQRLSSPPTVLMWAEHKKDNHYTSYELVIGMESTLYQAHFSYIPDRVQWKMLMSAYSIAPGGYIRTFTSVDVSRDRNNVYIGNIIFNNFNIFLLIIYVLYY